MLVIVFYPITRASYHNALYDLGDCLHEGGRMRGSSSVRQLIIGVSEQLKAGAIRLIDRGPEEAKEAKVRLDTHRAKSRERHARNKRGKTA